VDLLRILRGKSQTPQLQDWITWGQAASLQFPVGVTTPGQSSQLVRAKRNPPTTWEFLTVFQFSTTAADFAAAQTLQWQIEYLLGVGQVQTRIVRSIVVPNFATAPALQIGTLFGLLSSTGGPTPNTAIYTFQDKFPAEDIQVRTNIQWVPNPASAGQAAATVTAFAAPEVY
jgi:hypothetical protein